MKQSFLVKMSALVALVLVCDRSGNCCCVKEKSG